MSYPLWLQCYSDLCCMCLSFQSEAWVMALPAVYFSRPLVCYLGWNPCIHCLGLVPGIHIQLDGLFLLRSFLFMVSLTLSSSAGSSVYKACLVSLLRFILPATAADAERKKTQRISSMLLGPWFFWSERKLSVSWSFEFLLVRLLPLLPLILWCCPEAGVETKSQGIIPFFLICKGSVSCSLD